MQLKYTDQKFQHIEDDLDKNDGIPKKYFLPKQFISQQTNCIYVIISRKP